MKVATRVQTALMANSMACSLLWSALKPNQFSVPMLLHSPSSGLWVSLGRILNQPQAGLTTDPMLRLILISFGALGAFASVPVFWTLPAARLHGTAAAVGIAVINSIGNLVGFVGPWVIGYLRQTTGSFAGGLSAVGSAALLSAAIVMILRTLDQKA